MLVFGGLEIIFGIAFGSLSFISIGIIFFTKYLDKTIDEFIYKLKNYNDKEKVCIDVFETLLLSILLLTSSSFIIYNSIIRLIEPTFINNIYCILLVVAEICYMLYKIKICGDKDTIIIVKNLLFLFSFLIMYITGSTFIDSIVAIIISIITLILAFKEINRMSLLLLNTINIDIDLKILEEEIKKINGVKEIISIHVWNEEELSIALKIKGNNKVKLEESIKKYLIKENFKEIIIEIVK